MKHRLFIAITLSEELQKEILAWEVLWQKRLDSRIRWLAGKNLHLTLVPPWYEENVGETVRVFEIFGRHLVSAKRAEKGITK